MMAEAIAALFKGSRAWTDCAPIEEEIECLPSGSIVLVGDCPTGTDRIVREFVVRSDKWRQAFRKDLVLVAGLHKREEFDEVTCGWILYCARMGVRVPRSFRYLLKDNE